MRNKKTNPIQQVLNMQGKGKTQPSGVGGFLAAFFRSILDDINMNHMWWDGLMKEWLSDYKRGTIQTKQKITSMRGNLMKELGKDEMTFKVFYKGLRFLRPLKVEFSCRIHWRSKKITEHSHTMDFSNTANLAAMMEELKEDNTNEKEDDDDQSED